MSNSPHTVIIGDVYIAASGDTQYIVHEVGPVSITCAVKYREIGWAVSNPRARFTVAKVQDMLRSGKWRVLEFRDAGRIQCEDAAEIGEFLALMRLDFRTRLDFAADSGDDDNDYAALIAYDELIGKLTGLPVEITAQGEVLLDGNYPKRH